MEQENYNMNKRSLSSQLTNRSDPWSIGQDAFGARGDFPGGGVNLHVQRPSAKPPKTTFVSDKYTEKPTFSNDPAEWNKADYDFNINFLYDYMMKQKQYLKHEDYKYTQNKELLAHIKTQRQKDYDDAMWKKSESKRLREEITGYEWQIRHQSALGETSAIQFAAEDSLNRDLKRMHKKMVRVNEFQLKKEIEEGISPEVVEAHGLAKRLFEKEQEKRRRLQQKSHWYETELVNIKEALEKHADNAVKDTLSLPNIDQGNCHQIEENVGFSNDTLDTYAGSTLPEINKGKNNMVAPNLHSYNQNDQMMETASLTCTGYFPHPPTHKKDSKYQRFQRRIKNALN